MRIVVYVHIHSVVIAPIYWAHYWNVGGGGGGGGGGGNCQHTISLNKSNGSELLNMDVLSLSDQQPAVRVCLYTVILSKYIRYRNSVILGKL